MVAGTRTPLISTPTIKVDPGDTGGSNGQVVASSITSSRTPVLPGLLDVENRSQRPVSRAAPLAQQPSVVNEEEFMD
jgi:hypothetical protein